MKRVVRGVFVFLFVCLLPLTAQAAGTLVPVGALVGLEVRSGTVTVAAFDDLLGQAAREAGLKVGDQITAINGIPIRESEQVSQALDSGSGIADIQILRGSKAIRLQLEPKEQEGRRFLGVYLRQGISGIGTVTWYDPDTGTFGALGHGVSTAKDCLLPLVSGSIYPAQAVAAQKGKTGEPGLLKGKALSEAPMGTILRNTPQGIFGAVNGAFSGQPLPVAAWEDLHTGAAAIRSTVQGDEPREYSVEILKIYPKDRQTGRNLLLKVTDPELIAATGGIVQGMSGSPILQDGKLVGAVTHVLVNDPTAGYGIFIENMLEAAG